MITVTQLPDGVFALDVDGSVQGRYTTRQQAIRAAIELREQQDPIKIGVN